MGTIAESGGTSRKGLRMNSQFTHTDICTTEECGHYYMGAVGLDRAEELLKIHRQAEALLQAPEFESRFEAFLRPDQIGKWRLDNVCGYYWYLHALVAVTRPRKILELGRCLGTSALFMLGALGEDATLITVDIEERASDLSHVVADPRLQVVIGNDLDLGIYDGVDIGGIDFLYVDTDHTYDQASREWALYRPLLSERGIAVFDDITMNNMGTFWNELTCAKLETGGTYHYTGFGVVAPGSGL